MENARITENDITLCHNSRVVTSEGVSVGHVGTYFHQLQLATCHNSPRASCGTKLCNIWWF